MPQPQRSRPPRPRGSANRTRRSAPQGATGRTVVPAGEVRTSNVCSFDSLLAAFAAGANPRLVVDGDFPIARQHPRWVLGVPVPSVGALGDGGQDSFVG